MSVIIIGKYIALIDASHDNVLKDIGDVDACCAWHVVKNTRKLEVSQVVKNVPLAFLIYIHYFDRRENKAGFSDEEI